MVPSRFLDFAAVQLDILVPRWPALVGNLGLGILPTGAWGLLLARTGVREETEELIEQGVACTIAVPGAGRPRC